MAYVQQVCDGYNKKTLMGNWYEERLYPKQPFREEIVKAVYIHSFRPEAKMKELHASIIQASREPCLACSEEASGRQAIESFSTTDMYGWVDAGSRQHSYEV